MMGTFKKVAGAFYIFLETCMLGLGEVNVDVEKGVMAI